MGAGRRSAFASCSGVAVFGGTTTLGRGRRRVLDPEAIGLTPCCQWRQVTLAESSTASGTPGRQPSGRRRSGAAPPSVRPSPPSGRPYRAPAGSGGSQFHPRTAAGASG